MIIFKKTFWMQTNQGSKRIAEWCFEMISFSWHFFYSTFFRHVWKRHQSSVDAIAVRLNRVIKIVSLSSLLSATRDSANNMARCLMTRSITTLCPASKANNAMSRAHIRTSLEDMKRNRNSIAEYQRAIDEHFSSFFSSGQSVLCDYSSCEKFLIFLLV